MKVFDRIFRIGVGFLILVGLLCFYNAKKVLEWVEKRLLEKFEINIIVREREDVTGIMSYLEEIVEKYNNLSFSEKKFLTKKDVWDIVSEREELKYFSTLITRNPFPDIFKLKLSNFDTGSLLLLFEELSKDNLVKEIIYDTNIFSYLNRLMKTKKYFLLVESIIFLGGFFVLCYSGYNIYRIKSFYIIESIIVALLSIIIITFFNYRIVREINVQFYFTMQDMFVYGLIILISLSVMNLYRKYEK